MATVKQTKLEKIQFMQKFFTGECKLGGLYYVNKTLWDELQTYRKQTFLDVTGLHMISYEGIKLKERIHNIYFVPST